MLPAFGVLALAVGAAGWAHFGTLASLRAAVAGEDLYLPFPVVGLGDVVPGQVVDFDVPVVNRSAAAVTLVGGSADCDCVATEGLPAGVPAGGRAAARARLVVVDAPGRFRRTIYIYTDGRPGRLACEVTGRVLPPPAG